MRNNFILLLITLITSTNCAFAIQEGKVISDSATIKQTQEAFEDINQHTDSFFTPHVIKTQTDEEKRIRDLKKDPQTHGSLAPVKKFRLYLKSLDDIKDPKTTAKAKATAAKATAVEEPAATKDQAILDCDLMEYFAERTELEADGNVVMFFPQNNSTIKADKVIYNQTSNLVKAFGHVVLINDGRELFGDYMQIDLNEENAVLDNPVSDVFEVHAKAKKGYMYGDKIIQEQGSMYVTKKRMIDVKSEMFGPDLDSMYVSEKDKGYFMKEGHGEKFKIKTNDLIINSKKEHDTVTLKHAEIYFNEKKIGTVPSITIHTNKAQDYMEADFPEFGTVSNLGMFAGPGFVFDTPRGTTLKVIPILNYQSNGDTGTENKMGWGALGKFKSATNKTDFGYGTANQLFIMRGKQKLDDNLYLQYASNSWQDDWFMGFRMAKLMGELIYQEVFPQPDFLAKNMDMTFSHRIAAAYAQDGVITAGNQDAGPTGIGTMRFKYMAEAAQTLWKFGEEWRSPISGRLELVGQGSAAVYGTGDTQMLARVGPRIHNQYKWWMQDAGYFLSSYSDHTPLIYYDQYMYGRSNAYLRESFRICKYLTVSWMGSYNLLQDSWDGKMMQENTFFFAIGPDDVKLNIGYDTIRQQSFVTMSMHLDAKGSSIEYKKMVIKNPESIGKDKNGKSAQPDRAFSPVSPEDESEQLIQRAEVVDIEQEAL